ncbi:hypothetical protein A0128_12385 [Leptospira tipperaryensis]|uniref:Lipoprotein n=1 Tax=Leptospira tipperaryensis TaxID=2564040 RepID=A0A1D7UYB9_9LEPT|nr:hypothetical protein [Leptospira tipperaryensis]AOP34578.1 hypothetical protein A0128_12385 [Leptospira tipperaryensis]
MKLLLSFYLSITILFQAVVFSSGLFGCVLAEQAKICECNHGSRVQKHSNKEDDRFSKVVRSKSETSHVSKKLPDCHSAKSGETHACACKKSENKASQLSAFHSVLFNPATFWIVEPVSDLLEIIVFKDLNTGIHSSFSLLKPPQFS